MFDDGTLLTRRGTFDQPILKPTVQDPKTYIKNNISNLKIDRTAGTSGTNNNLAPTWMRYIPAFASGFFSLTDALEMTNKPDYGEADAVLEAAKAAGIHAPTRFNTIGDYMTDQELDLELAINKANAESAAARRAIMNTSGGNRS